MKSRVLGLFSLALLGFVCAKRAQSDDSERSLTDAPIDNARTKTRTTRETESITDTDTDSGNGNGNDNNNSDNTNNLPAVNTNMTNSTSATLGPKPTMMTGSGDPKPETSMNGQGHIFTSVGLLLGSLVLVALCE
ncbi:hypothetical protein INR49_027415 [Caranx melampygus]|nr:hypothetical protein INR49_027415 [Caranx melampygus]